MPPRFKTPPRVPRNQSIEFTLKESGKKYERIVRREGPLHVITAHPANEPNECRFFDCRPTGAFTMKLLPPILLLLMSFTALANDSSVMSYGSNASGSVAHSFVESERGNVQRTIIFCDVVNASIERLTYTELAIDWSEYIDAGIDDQLELLRADPMSEPTRVVTKPNSLLPNFEIPEGVTVGEVRGFFTRVSNLSTNSSDPRAAFMSAANFVSSNSEKDMKIIEAFRTMLRKQEQ